jgi:hypothetical protein
LLAAVLFGPPAALAQVQIEPTVDGTSLRLTDRPAFHETRAQVRDLRTVNVPGSPSFVVLWSEGDTHYYAISLDGRSVQAVRPARYELLLQRGAFDPLVNPQGSTASALPPSQNLHIVQFVTQPLEAYRAAITALGGEVLSFLPHHAHIVRMDGQTLAQVRGLPFVRWIGEYHPEYRTEEYLLDGLTRGTLPDQLQPYNIQFLERGVPAKLGVAELVEVRGGVAGPLDASSFLTVLMDPGTLRDVLADDAVLYVDRYFAPTESDMDVARELSGANYLQTMAGYTGQGVRGEVADGNLRTTHQEFTPVPLIHGPVSGDSSHGTPVTSIVFADGVDAMARGSLPNSDAIIFADTGTFGWTQSTGGPTKGMPGSRYDHTAELVDPSNVYKAVFQTNSTGSPQVTNYTSVSAQMDEIVFDHDIIICQSQSNTGNQNSRPQAWGKNMIGVGGIRHQNTLTTADDTWGFGGSIGPAEDGRIKPDLAHFYDNIRAAASTSNSSYTSTFGGTSGATPITAGHFGLFFQMWHEGIFGNPTGASVFDSKPHFTTAKAMLVNTATQWSFSGTGHDLTRVHQGWGRADVRTMYDLRDKMLIVDEADVLTNLASKVYQVTVAPGEPALKATLVYADPMGTTSATQHRINDLTLKVTSPGGTVYWGNNGLLANQWSTAGGSPNSIDTVENVFVQNPEAGSWLVEVIASEINVDTHVETPAMDADYALVVSGVEPSPCAGVGPNFCTAKAALACGPSTIGASGTPSASATSGFVVTAAPATGNRLGFLLYNTSSVPGLPFAQTGTLCVNPAGLRRAGIVGSGGTNNQCDGAFTIDMNAFAQGLHVPPPGQGTTVPAGFLTSPGTTVHAQIWGRDTQATGELLSDALSWAICP